MIKKRTVTPEQLRWAEQFLKDNPTYPDFIHNHLTEWQLEGLQGYCQLQEMKKSLTPVAK